jgi:hypothetical protein
MVVGLARASALGFNICLHCTPFVDDAVTVWLPSCVEEWVFASLASALDGVRTKQGCCWCCEEVQQCMTGLLCGWAVVGTCP